MAIRLLNSYDCMVCICLTASSQDCSPRNLWKYCAIQNCSWKGQRIKRTNNRGERQCYHRNIPSHGSHHKRQHFAILIFFSERRLYQQYKLRLFICFLCGTCQVTFDSSPSVSMERAPISNSNIERDIGRQRVDTEGNSHEKQKFIVTEDNSVQCECLPQGVWYCVLEFMLLDIDGKWARISISK